MIDDEHGGELPPMLTKVTDDERVKRSWTPDHDWQSSVIGNTKSIMVVEEGGYEPPDQDDVCPPEPFQRWDWDLIEHFCRFYDGLERDDEANLKRHYMELRYNNENTDSDKDSKWVLHEKFVILLPPKK
jgi:hypothetical protein